MKKEFGFLFILIFLIIPVSAFSFSDLFDNFFGNSKKVELSPMQATGEISCNPWDAVKIAYENNKPLVIFHGNFISCSWAKDFKNDVLLTSDWKNYARENGIAYFTTYQPINDNCNKWGGEGDIYGSKDYAQFSEPFVNYGLGSGQFIVFKIKNYIDPKTINSYYSEFYSDGSPKTSVSIKYSYDKLVELKNLLKNHGTGSSFKRIYINKETGEYDPSITKMNPRYEEISAGTLQKYTREISQGWFQQQFNSENAEFLFSSFTSHPSIRYLEGSHLSSQLSSSKPIVQRYGSTKYMLGGKELYSNRPTNLILDYTYDGFIRLFESLINTASPGWLEGTSQGNVDNSGNNPNSPNIPPSNSVSNSKSREENWTCTDWSECYSIGRKTRTCIDLNNVGTTFNKPLEVYPCKPCLSTWNCKWGECISGMQQLICTDLNRCNPEETQIVRDFKSCGSCIENWTCSPTWSECIDGIQTITCIDNEDCGTIYNKPSEEQYCDENCIPNWTCSPTWSECIDGIQTRTCRDTEDCGLPIPFDLFEEKPCYCMPNWVAVEEPCQLGDIYNIWYNDTNFCEGEFKAPASRVEICDYNGDGIIGSVSDLQGLTFNLQDTSSGNKKVVLAEGDINRVEFDYNPSNGILNLKNVKLTIQDSNSQFGYLVVEGLIFNKKVLVDRLNENSNKICIKNNQTNSIHEVSIACNEPDEFILDCPGQKNGIGCEIVGNYFSVSGLKNSAIREVVSGIGSPEWNCSLWSKCSEEGKSQMICNDLNKNFPDKTETKDCSFIECSSKWVCSDWGECSNKKQERDCVDFNECEDNKIETKDCGVEENTKIIIFALVILFILTLVIFISLILKNKKKKNKTNSFRRFSK